MGKKSQREVALLHERWAAQLLEQGNSDFEKAQVGVLHTNHREYIMLINRPVLGITLFYYLAPTTNSG